LEHDICEAKMRDDADAGHAREELWIRQVHDTVLQAAVGKGRGAHDSPPPEQLVVQLHNLVDQAVGLVWSMRSLARSAGWSLPAPVSALASRLLRQALAPVPAHAGHQGLLVLTDVTPGNLATGRLDASNHGERRRDVRLVWTPMVSDQGLQLGGDYLRLEPDVFTLEPRDTRTVTVTLAVPASARPGTYTGDLSAADNPAVRLQMLVQVQVRD
jgi:hypothetical protein